MVEPEPDLQVQVGGFPVLARVEEVAGKREEGVQPAGEAVHGTLEAIRRTGVERNSCVFREFPPAVLLQEGVREGVLSVRKPSEHAALQQPVGRRRYACSLEIEHAGHDRHGERGV